jgi:hypothetical protein
VIGTRNRFQCSQAAAAATAPDTEATTPPTSASWSFGGSPTPTTILNPTAANTPPTNASSSRIDGSAIRRLAVKNSASPQAVAATNSGASGQGRHGRQPARLTGQSITDPADREQQDRGGNRLNVVEAADQPKFSSSTRRRRWLSTRREAR